MIDALAAGDIYQIAAAFGNKLTPVTTALHPEVGLMIDQMRTFGAINAAMSGSGPSVFGYFMCEDSAYCAYQLLKKNMEQVYITKPHVKG